MNLTQTLLKGIFLIGSIALCSTALAQRPTPGEQTGTISGTVTDESGGQALEFATVAVHSAKDSSLVTGGITDL